MTPRDFAFTIVLPTARELLTQRHDCRIAYLACCTTFHLAGVIADADRVERWRIHDSVLLECGPAFQLIEGVTHGRLTVESIDGGATAVVGLVGAITTSGFGMGRFKDSGDQTANDRGQKTDVYDSVLSVMRYFAATFPKHFSSRRAST